MPEQEIAIENSILKVRVGSHLYGTNLESSDEDFVGIFIPTEDYILGFKRIEQVDISTKSKQQDGKNSKDAIDYTAYTLHKFARLALDNNPNIIEIMFVDYKNVNFINKIGSEFLSYNMSFPSKNIKHRFLGYAFSQKHKMVIKLENYEKINEAISFLERHEELEFVLDIQHPLFERKKDIIRVGDVNIPAAFKCKKAKENLQRRLQTFGNRKELVERYHYDVKFGSHLIRLMKEGIELLSTGYLKFPLEYKDLLIDIRTGKYELGQVLELSDKLEKETEETYEKSKLPNTPDFNTIEQFVIKVHRDLILNRK